MGDAAAYERALAELTAGLDALGLPRERVCMPHVRLRGLHERTGLDYADCARLVLDALGAFAPRAVLVPAFTYSFCRTGVFHRLFSRSEAGRFSEEVRLNHARYRTPDPVFSVMDTTDWLGRQVGLRFDGAFEPGCVWERFEGADGWIVNLDIEVMVATHVHYCERVADVPYRDHVFFGGVVYEDERRHGRVDYDYHARDLAADHDLDWRKVEALCLEAGLLRDAEACGVRLRGFSAREFSATVLRALAADAHCLLSPTAELEGNA